MAATTQELLDAVNDAILAKMNSGAVQSYSIGGRNLQHMNITELMNMRDRLQKQVNAGKSTKNYADFKRPS